MMPILAPLLKPPFEAAVDDAGAAAGVVGDGVGVDEVGEGVD